MTIGAFRLDSTLPYLLAPVLPLPDSSRPVLPHTKPPSPHVPISSVSRPRLCRLRPVLPLGPLLGTGVGTVGLPLSCVSLLPLATFLLLLPSLDLPLPCRDWRGALSWGSLFHRTFSSSPLLLTSSPPPPSPPMPLLPLLPLLPRHPFLPLPLPSSGWLPMAATRTCCSPRCSSVRWQVDT